MKLDNNKLCLTKQTGLQRQARTVWRQLYGNKGRRHMMKPTE